VFLKGIFSLSLVRLKNCASRGWMMFMVCSRSSWVCCCCWKMILVCSWSVLLLIW